jgi:dUTP pyrophosphatase
MNPKIEFVSNLEPDESNTTMIIPAGESILIPGGIKMEIPFGYMGLFLNKSGVASKKKLLIGAQVIDTFYSGEVHINLNNVSNENTSFNSGDKLAQLVMVPILCCDMMEVSEDKLYDKMTQDSNRGEAGFGSTDKK